MGIQKLFKSKGAKQEREAKRVVIGAIPVGGAEKMQSSMEDESYSDEMQQPARRKSYHFHGAADAFETHGGYMAAIKKIAPWVLAALAVFAIMAIALNYRDPGDITLDPNKGDDTPVMNYSSGVSGYTAPSDEPSHAPVITPSPSPTPYVTPTPTPTPVPSYTLLKQGMNGNEVKSMQGMLIDLGYLALGKDDGDFGNGTKEAVRAFQKVNSLDADGVAGEKTLTLLYSGTAKEDTDPFVWVVDNGTVYHNDPNCSDMVKPKQIKKSEAGNRKLTACELCY